MGQQGRTMVILQARRHRLNPHNSWCVSLNCHKSMTKTLFSYLLNYFYVRLVTINKTALPFQDDVES